jgi:hypothetical protein
MLRKLRIWHKVVLFVKNTCCKRSALKFCVPYTQPGYASNPDSQNCSNQTSLTT